jgi:hypothetical protein
MMAEQLRGPFEKFVDSLYSKKRPSQYRRKVPTLSNKVNPLSRYSAGLRAGRSGF